MIKRRSFASTDILLFLMVTIWGFNFSVLKVVLREFLPMSFNILRFSSSSISLIFLLLLLGRKLSIDRQDWARIVMLAIIGHTCYQLFFIYGINEAAASNAALLMSSTPILTGVISTIFGYEKVRPLTWVGIFMSFLGIFLILRANPSGFDFSSASFRGNILILFASVNWALYTVIAKPLLKKYSSLKLTAITMAIGTIFMIPFSINEIMKQNWQNISSTAWLGLAYSSLLAIAMGYTIWYRGVEKVGATRTAIYSNLTPVLAVFFAWLILSETITLYHFLGAGIIFIGIRVTHIDRNRKRLKEV